MSRHSNVVNSWSARSPNHGLLFRDDNPASQFRRQSEYDNYMRHWLSHGPRALHQTREERVFRREFWGGGGLLTVACLTIDNASLSKQSLLGGRGGEGWGAGGYEYRRNIFMVELWRVGNIEASVSHSVSLAAVSAQDSVGTTTAPATPPYP